MESWFNTPERVQRLREEARRWVGTPFMPNSNTPGPNGGVSCQKLASEIYRRAGWRDIPVPEVSMAHARFGSRRSLLEPFMDARPEFMKMQNAECRVQNVQAGDLLGFRLKLVVHHCGIYLGGGQFVHAMDHVGTLISNLSDATWLSRWVVSWRPLGTNFELTPEEESYLGGLLAWQEQSAKSAFRLGS